MSPFDKRAARFLLDYMLRACGNGWRKEVLGRMQIVFT